MTEMLRPLNWVHAQTSNQNYWSFFRLSQMTSHSCIKWKANNTNKEMKNEQKEVDTHRGLQTQNMKEEHYF